MKTPIIVIADNSTIYFYDSIEKAGSAMETIDVRNGVYRAYDADGYLLNLEIVIEKNIGGKFRDYLIWNI